mgnify:FL=1
MRRNRKLAQVRFKYGLTQEQYDDLQKSTNGCEICGTKQYTLSIDHDHVTKKVRGLLCPNCNRALGLFYDSVESLKKAINYLERH